MSIRHVLKVTLCTSQAQGCQIAKVNDVINLLSPDLATPDEEPPRSSESLVSAESVTDACVAESVPGVIVEEEMPESGSRVPSTPDTARFCEEVPVDSDGVPIIFSMIDLPDEQKDNISACTSYTHVMHQCTHTLIARESEGKRWRGRD